jgi:hypothetical protein
VAASLRKIAVPLYKRVGRSLKWNWNIIQKRGGHTLEQNSPYLFTREVAALLHNIEISFMREGAAHLGKIAKRAAITGLDGSVAEIGNWWLLCPQDLIARMIT